MKNQSFSVRCVFQWSSRPDMTKKYLYEERMTLWKAANIDESIELAEDEAKSYANHMNNEYLGLAQAYHMYDESSSSGIEVFSLLRDSDLKPEDYLDKFFYTGNERQK